MKRLFALLIALMACGGFAADRADTLKWFLENEYGVRPEAAEMPKVSFAQTAPDAVTMDGKAVRKVVRCEYTGPYGKGSFNFIAFIPKSDKPSPAFLLICISDPNEAMDPERKVKSGSWPAEEIISRGYAALAFFYGDLVKETYTPNTALASGVFSVYEKPEERTTSSWGALSAWAWGASRIMDWIETEKTIDAKKVAVIGHSRGGKSALVAGVTDTRFAMVVSNNSGTGGAKLNAADLPKSEPCASFAKFGVQYWFCPKFREVFENKDKTLAHDQDEWLALVAPRLLCVRSAAEDAWAGPEGERLATVKAAKTWQELGKPECVDYSIREGKHNLTLADWTHYLDFADARWRGAGASTEHSK